LILLGVALKRFGAFFAIAFVVLGLAGRPATAATIPFDPNPTTAYLLSISVPAEGSAARLLTFTLTRPADLTVYLSDAYFPGAGADPVNFGVKFFLGALDYVDTLTAPELASLSGLSKDTPYTAILFLDNRSPRSTWSVSYNLQFTSVATTPIPASLPLFAAALAGLGFCGWRKRNSAAPAV
jgi:hypothetical protein